MKKRVIISLGGSIMIPEEIDKDYLKKFVSFILEYVSQGFSFVIITGGGKICRKYQAVAKELASVTDEQNDYLGIEVTRLNAKLLQLLFKEYAFEKIITNPTEAISSDKPIYIGAGYKPGCSTDTDAALMAQNIGTDIIINLSNTSYIYDKDPRKHEEAKPFKRLTWQELEDIVGDDWAPGLNMPFDPIATKLAKKQGLKVYYINGHDFESLGNVLREKDFNGTLISPTLKMHI